jgi:hypothetical protein
MRFEFIRYHAALVMLRYWRPILLVSLVVLFAGSAVNACNDWGHRRELADMNNQIAAAEETRRVDEGVWARRLFVATKALEMSELDRLGMLRELDRLDLEKRGLYNLALKYRAELVGTSRALADSAGGTRIPISLADGSAHADGEVRIGGHRVPETAPIDITLAIWLDKLYLSLAIGEADDGSLTAVAKSADPHVRDIGIEGITDMRQTGFAADPPSRIKWGLIGGALGAIACLFWC